MRHVLSLKIFPSSGRQEIKAEPTGIIKCYLQSPPEKGKANSELIEFLAKKLKIPRTQLDIISGATGRNKRVSIETEISLDELYKRLGIEFPQLTIV